MFAIIKVGANQYLVKKGDVLEVSRLPMAYSGELRLDKVLLASRDGDYKIGTPYVKDAYVEAEVLGEIKGPKVISYKYRRRKASHWKKGHRQNLSRIKVKEIYFG